MENQMTQDHFQKSTPVARKQWVAPVIEEAKLEKAAAKIASSSEVSLLKNGS